MKWQRLLGAAWLVVACAAVASAQPPAKPKTTPGETKGAAGQPKASTAKLGTPADESAVRALVDQYQQAFNSADPRRAADVYAQNAVFVDEMGRVWDGKAEIERGLTESDPAGRPRLTLTTEAVRFVKPDVALMRGTSMVEGSGVPPGGGAGHWAVVAVKVAGQWKVVAAQAAVKPPAGSRAIATRGGERRRPTDVYPECSPFPPPAGAGSRRRGRGDRRSARRKAP